MKYTVSSTEFQRKPNSKIINISGIANQLQFNLPLPFFVVQPSLPGSSFRRPATAEVWKALPKMLPGDSERQVPSAPGDTGVLMERTGGFQLVMGEAPKSME